MGPVRGVGKGHGNVDWGLKDDTTDERSAEVRTRPCDVPVYQWTPPAPDLSLVVTVGSHLSAPSPPGLETPDARDDW